MHNANEPHSGHIALALAIVVIGIVFGSLYPFAYRVPPEGAGPLHALLASWPVPPGRGDALANILLYIPFGLFATLALRHRSRLYGGLLAVVVVGGVLSTAMELAQYFDEGRVTSAADVYTNTLGTAIGAAAGSIFRFNTRFLTVDRLLANPVPTMLLATWAAYRLFPYEPTIDLHKYWHTVEPLLGWPTLRTYDLYRHTVVWLTIAGGRRSMILAVSFAAGVLAAKVLIIDAWLSIAEVAGAALAICLQPAFEALGRRGLVLLAALLAGYIVTERLEPFAFLPTAHHFGWMPFASFLSGSLRVNVLSFLEKVFLYGSLMFLATEVGMRLGVAALLLATMLLATSWIEIYLPGRSAEITDAVMALLVAALFSLLRPERQDTQDPSAAAT